LKGCLEETKIVFFAAIVLDILFVVGMAIFSELNMKIFIGLLIGTLYAIINQVVLWHTVNGLVRKARVKLSYGVSYMIRFIAAAICLTIGFLYLNPFAVVVPMLAPKVGYYFMAFTGKDI